MNYTLYVDDNYHYMDKNERYQAGEFNSLERAIKKAKSIVDEFLLQAHKEGMLPDELYRQYTTFGEDPYIVGGPPSTTFNAWDYAKKRCGEICGKET